MFAGAKVLLAGSFQRLKAGFGSAGPVFVGLIPGDLRINEPDPEQLVVQHTDDRSKFFDRKENTDPGGITRGWHARRILPLRSLCGTAALVAVELADEKCCRWLRDSGRGSAGSATRHYRTRSCSSGAIHPINPSSEPGCGRQTHQSQATVCRAWETSPQTARTSGPVSSAWGSTGLSDTRACSRPGRGKVSENVPIYPGYKHALK